MLKNIKAFKAFTLLMAFVVLLASVPMYAFAASTESDTQVTNSTESSMESVEEGAFTQQSQEYVIDDSIGAVSEVVSLREENTKHFRLNNGKYKAITYASPVHRLGSNGKWQDIDNNLYQKTVKDVTVYSTADSRVIFSPTFQFGSELFILNENNYTISMIPMSTGKISAGTLIPIVPTAPVITNADKRAEGNVYESIAEASNIDNRSSILYTNIREYTDIEYVLESNNIKENIIIKNPTDSYEYIFKISLKGLSASLDSSGCVVISDLETSQPKYYIPSPFMYDTSGEYSYDVNYELTQASNGVYLLAVVASEEWINSEDRAFPVVIDPTIQGATSVDTYIDSENPNASYASANVLYVSETKTALIKPVVPNLPLNIKRIDSAELYVSYYNAGDDFVVGLYGVTGMIDSTTTYNTNLSISTTRTDSAVIYSSSEITENNPRSIGFTITQLFSDWYYSASIAYGVAIKYYSGPEETVSIKSSETTNAPYLVVEYTQQIPDGVYAIKSAYSSSYWMSIEGVNTTAGSNVQYKEAETSPATIFDRTGLFKISGANGTGMYIIRLMTNNNLTIAVSGDEIITKEIPSKDEDVPYEDTFAIVRQGSNYLIVPNSNNSGALSIDTIANQNLTLAPRTTTTTMMKWSFEQYTGSDMCGSTIYFPVDFYVGEKASFMADSWSTKIDYNTTKITIDQDYSYYATCNWNDSTQSALVAFHQDGSFVVNVLIYNSDGVDFLTSSHDFSVSLLVDEGEHFIQNKETETLMQIDNDEMPDYSTSGSIMELWDFDGGPYQKWNFVHIQDGYYKILSKKSGLALSVQSEYLDDDGESVVQEAYSNTSRKQWKITKTSSGAYAFRPKSSEAYSTDWCLSAGSQFLWIESGLDVEQRQYQNDDDYKDEWNLFYTEGTNAMLLGIVEQNHPHHAAYGIVMSILCKLGCTDFNYIVEEQVEQETIVDGLEDAVIYVSRSHGGYDTQGTHIKISENDNIHSTEIYDFSTDTALVDLSNCQLALFVACNTGRNENNSLPHAAVAAGAEASIGFKDKISCSDANEWVKLFFACYAQGFSIEYAAEHAASGCSDDRLSLYRIVLNDE